LRAMREGPRSRARADETRRQSEELRRLDRLRNLGLADRARDARVARRRRQKQQEDQTKEQEGRARTDADNVGKFSFKREVGNGRERQRVTDNVRVAIGRCLENFVPGRRLKPLSEIFAGMYGTNMKEGAVFPDTGTVRYICSEFGALALAEIAAMLKTWIDNGDTLTLIADAATIGQGGKYQAIGFLRTYRVDPADQDSELRFQRLIVGCAKVMVSTDDNLLYVCKQLLGDLVQCHNWIFCGILPADKEWQEIIEKHQASPESVGVNECDDAGLYDSEVDRVQPLEFSTLVKATKSTITDHGESVINKVVSWFNNVANNRWRILQVLLCAKYANLGENKFEETLYRRGRRAYKKPPWNAASKTWDARPTVVDADWKRSKAQLFQYSQKSTLTQQRCKVALQLVAAHMQAEQRKNWVSLRPDDRKNISRYLWEESPRPSKRQPPGARMYERGDGTYPRPLRCPAPPRKTWDVRLTKLDAAAWAATPDKNSFHGFIIDKPISKLTRKQSAVAHLLVGAYIQAHYSLVPEFENEGAYEGAKKAVAADGSVQMKGKAFLALCKKRVFKQDEGKFEGEFVYLFAAKSHTARAQAAKAAVLKSVAQRKDSLMRLFGAETMDQTEYNLREMMMYCDLHKVMLLMKGSLASTGEMEDILGIELGWKNNSNCKGRRGGRFLPAFLHSICKMFAFGTFSEVLTKRMCERALMRYNKTKGRNDDVASSSDEEGAAEELEVFRITSGPAKFKGTYTILEKKGGKTKYGNKSSGATMCFYKEDGEDGYWRLSIDDDGGKMQYSSSENVDHRGVPWSKKCEMKGEHWNLDVDERTAATAGAAATVGAAVAGAAGAGAGPDDALEFQVNQDRVDISVLGQPVWWQADEIWWERLTHTRGEAGYFANALPTLMMILDLRKFGLKKSVERYTALRKLSQTDQNRLLHALEGALSNPFLIPAVRACAALHLLIFRPIVTFVENDHTSKFDTIRMWLQVKAVLTTLANYSGEDWDACEEDGGLPWITKIDDDDAEYEEEADYLFHHSAVLHVALHDRVIGGTYTKAERTELSKGGAIKPRVNGTARARKTMYKRKAGLEIVLKEGDAARQQLANRYLNTMAKAALIKFEYHNDEKKFDGRLLKALSGDDTYSTLIEVAKGTQTTSKGVETTFALASYLQELFQGMKPKSRHNILYMQEAKIGKAMHTMLVHAPERAHIYMDRARARQLGS
jgi:hypothetical protein